MTHRPTALFAMHARHLPMIFPVYTMAGLRRLVDVDETLVAERFDSPDVQAVLADVEILVTGWGCPPIDATVLRTAPRLRAILHAAGSVKGHLAPECWERGIVVSSAADAQRRTGRRVHPRHDPAGRQGRVRGCGSATARERTFALGEIRARHRATSGRRGGDRRRLPDRPPGRPAAAAVRPGRVLADPYVAAAAAGAELLELDDLLRESDVVSLHAPATPETHHLLDKPAPRPHPRRRRPHQHRPRQPGRHRRPRRTSSQAAGSAPSSTSPTRSRCPRTPRCSTCRTSSSPRTSPAPTATSWTGSAARSSLSWSG